MMNRFRIYLAVLQHSLQFLRRRRERKEAAIAAERTHQLAMLRLITGALEAQSASHLKQVEVLVERVAASQSLIEQWLRGFQNPTSVGNGTPLEPINIPESDPYDLIARDAFLAAYGDELPPEFALAFELQKDEQLLPSEPASPGEGTSETDF